MIEPSYSAELRALVCFAARLIAWKLRNSFSVFRMTA